MSDLLIKRATVSPDQTALLAPEHLDEPLPYAELLEQSRDVREQLEKTGICPGERVGLIMENRPDLLRMFHGALLADCPPVLFHANLTAYELNEQWPAIDASVLICSSDTEEVAREAVGSVPVLSVDDPENEDVFHLRESGRCTAHASDVRTDGDHVILFTSGSTEEPRPVCLTMEQLRASAFASGTRLGHLPSDVWYDPLPMHHMGGLAPVVRSTLYGSTVLLEPFEAERVPELIPSFDVTCISMVPTMCSRVMEEGGWSGVTDVLRFLLLGGASVPEELIQQAADINLPVFPTYGLTETASQVATATPHECFEDPTTVGYPLFETEVTICDEDGNPVNPGEEGVIHVDGPTVMEGYFQRPLLNDRLFTHNGFRTDDRGYLDQQGRLHVVSGASSQIVTGGENVDPEEVRNTLLDHGRLADAVVFGMEDREWGEKVMALVVSKDESVDEQEVRSEVQSLLDERLSSYKHPKEIVFVQDIPRTSKGTLRQKQAEKRIRSDEEDESVQLDLGEGLGTD